MTSDELRSGRARTERRFCYELAAVAGRGCLSQRLLEPPLGDVLLSV